MRNEGTATDPLCALMVTNLMVIPPEEAYVSYFIVGTSFFQNFFMSF